jgi:hypothetical protein
MRSERLVPLTGVLFLVLLIASFAIGGEPPEASEDVGEIVDHYVDNKDSIIIGAIGSGLAAVALVFFGGYLSRTLSDAQGGRGFLPSVVLAGTAIIAVGAGIDGTISFALAEAVEDIDPAAVQALQALWDNDFLPIMIGILVFLLSAGLAIIQSGALPRWLGWVALVLVVLGATPIGFVAFVGSAIWILIVSIMLSVRAGRAQPAQTPPGQKTPQVH